MPTLRASLTSPYARKARALLIETGMTDRVTLQVTDPWAPDTDLPQDNPLGKVPTLITDDGVALFDSNLVCEYLDTLHDGPALFPAAGPERWRALRLTALGNGVLDAAVHCVLESRRPPEIQHAPWVARQHAAIERACTALAGDVASSDGPVTIGTLTAAIALDYLDFRLPDFPWRADRAGLAAFHANWSARPSLRDTAPPRA